ncbi:acid phosphatase/Vanadium-dependent haloperoxidase [Hypoxylon rubiginosum]|uniref:Acid phosphatase/Vanadium-dependent haloperoxidase n=1 Tax=Hypoxylon rubiginosum TaxID=110542 RepID=A0ACC0CIW8_9PEZI|nr:acid phosphatase/Vanadium-dependent haloperoxidase [Hypoxylon rubiginosum]
MGFFNRRRPEGAGAGAGTTSHAKHNNRPAFDATAYPMATRPTFGQWLKVTWLDIITMICMGAIGLGVYEANPAPTRSFAVTFSDGEVVYPEFAYPMRKEIIPIWLAAFLAAIIPIFIILCMQIRVRSFWDVNNGIIGLLYSLITAAVFQVFLKWLIGGLRPHFLAACKPDVSLASNAPGVKGAGYNAAGWTSIYYTTEICTGDQNEINDSLESFPSGHSTAAFAGFVYLYLYLNAKLKVFANYHPAMWKLVAIYAPILGATLIAGALTIDEFHNWYDVVAGAIIGTVMAFSAYRMCYAAVWDWRWNHVPLHRGQPCLYTHDGVELMDALFTRRAGWGAGAGAGGAFGGHSNNAHGGVAGYPRKPVGGANTARRGDEMV